MLRNEKYNIRKRKPFSFLPQSLALLTACLRYHATVVHHCVLLLPLEPAVSGNSFSHRDIKTSALLLTQDPSQATEI